MSPSLFVATAVAGFVYVISPGPAFLAVFSLAAAEGRGAAARFVTGHLAGDITWGALALTAIIGANRIGPVLFDCLGLGCGAYLISLGLRAVTGPAGPQAGPAGSRRPLATGVVFGLTNPKAYPVSTAMFTAIALPYAGRISWSDTPAMLTAAFLGFVLADLLIVGAAGLPAVRRFFSRHGGAVTRMVGVLFIAFGAKSIADAGRGFASRS